VDFVSAGIDGQAPDPGAGHLRLPAGIEDAGRAGEAAGLVDPGPRAADAVEVGEVASDVDLGADDLDVANHGPELRPRPIDRTEE